MIDENKFSKKRPVIKPEHLGGAQHAIVHISHVEEVKIDGQDKLSMRFAEFPEDPARVKPSGFFPNLTQIKRLIAAFGRDEKTWIGKPIVLEVTQAPDPSKDGAEVDVLWIADPKNWEGHFEAARVEAEGAGTRGKASSRSRR